MNENYDQLRYNHNKQLLCLESFNDSFHQISALVDNVILEAPGNLNDLEILSVNIKEILTHIDIKYYKLYRDNLIYPSDDLPSSIIDVLKKISF